MPSRPKKHRDMGCEYHYSKKETIASYPTPKNTKALRSFLGLTGFYIHEYTYPITELEALAMIHAITKFDVYLRHNYFIVYTDYLPSSVLILFFFCEEHMPKYYYYSF